VELAHNELITKIIPNANAQQQSDINGVDKSGGTGRNDDEDENNRRIQDCLLQVYLDFPISAKRSFAGSMGKGMD
jgi:hypothetical protein